MAGTCPAYVPCPSTATSPERQEAAAESARESAIHVPFAQDGSCFHPLLQKPRSSTYTVGDKGLERTFESFEAALAYLKTMPVAKWRRPNAKGNWGIVAAVRWGILPRE